MIELCVLLLSSQLRSALQGHSQYTPFSHPTTRTGCYFGQAANSCISRHASCVGYLFGFSLPHSCPSSWPNWVWCCLQNGIRHTRGALTMGSGLWGLSLQVPGVGSLTSIYSLTFTAFGGSPSVLTWSSHLFAWSLVGVLVIFESKRGNSLHSGI